MHYCSRCNYREFNSENALHAHCRDKSDHPYCEDCRILFGSSYALNTHLDRVHYDSNNDYESSDDSDRCYDSDEDEAVCLPCNRVFKNRPSYFQHLAASASHNWCFACSRDFSTPQALAQHSSSRVHRPRDIRCPLCSETFKMVSAIAQHVESGACRSGVNRHTVTRVVQSLDLARPVAINRRIMGGPVPRTITYFATDRAFNGTAFECYLCHKTFNRLDALNNHLGSAAHDSKEFRCPKCRKEFTLISALVHHIESEACGIARFNSVRDQFQGLTDSFRRMLTI